MDSDPTFHIFSWYDMLVEEFFNRQVDQSWSSDADCTYVSSSFLDFSASPEIYAFCKNDSYILFPSEWTNETFINYTMLYTLYDFE
jgi:hypothetical protein